MNALAIARSRGGLTTKIHAAVDALGLPLRFEITPGHWGDCPQARELLEGLDGVGHVIADAAYDADHLRAFIAADLGATAMIKQTQREAGKRPSIGRSTRSAISSSASSTGSNASAASPSVAKRPSRHSAPSSPSPAQWRGSRE